MKPRRQSRTTTVLLDEGVAMGVETGLAPAVRMWLAGVRVEDDEVGRVIVGVYKCQIGAAARLRVFALVRCAVAAALGIPARRLEYFVGFTRCRPGRVFVTVEVRPAGDPRLSRKRAA